jgi:hypothetical protein
MITDPGGSPASANATTPHTNPPRVWHLPGPQLGWALCGVRWLDRQQPVRFGDECLDCVALTLSGQ